MLSSLLALFGVLALLAGSSMWKGYVLTVLWGWFIVPTFDLPTLALAPAIGISMTVSYLTYQYDSSKKSEDAENPFVRAVSYSLLMPALVLGVGWIVQKFM